MMDAKPFFLGLGSGLVCTGSCNLLAVVFFYSSEASF